MNRRDKILYHVNESSIGVEIGPSHNPVAPKKGGYRVHIIDHMSKEELVKKYKDHNVQLDNIEEVDFIWRGESYSELTGKSKFYNWIIASHLIEHTPNLIGFLNGCDSILKDDGVISLAIPDKRYCFDHFRPITGIAVIIDSHFQRNKIHSPGTVAEYFLNVVSRDGNIAWSHLHEGEYRFFHTVENACEAIKRVTDERIYYDVHSWCFTPYSFRLIIHDLNLLGFIPFKEVSFFPTEGCEFYITLSRKGAGPQIDRLEILKAIESELSL